MLVAGDYALGPATADSGLELAAKRTVAVLYITLIYIGDHLLILGPVLAIVSATYAALAIRTQIIGYRVLLAVSLSGLLYPTIWVVAEILDWDAGLFN